MISDPLALSALIAFTAALAFWLDRTVPRLSKVGASLLVLVFGAVLSNLGVVPAASPVYEAIAGPVTSLAIAWLLLSVDLSDLKRAGPRMLTAFGLALVGTALGAFVGALALGTTIGQDTWRLAGVFTGTYSGGSVNFVSVGRGVELPDSLWAGATAADALTTGLWMAATLVLPVWLARFYGPIPKAFTETHDGGDAHHPFFAPASVNALDLSVLLAAALGLLAAAELTAMLLPGIPSILWLTTYALVLGHTRPFRKPEGALQLGTMVLHLFFVVIGIWSRVSEIVAVGVVVFVYTLVLVVVHGLVVFGGGRLLKLDLGSLSVASQASVGGPSSAIAVAVAREWPGLVLPGIIVGLAGYAVGNYLGFGVAAAVRALGVGP